jgi:hypothetical protein
MKELTLPFGLSPGCEPYVNEFLLKIGVQKPDRPEEICQGGLVFSVGEKEDCRECARTCSGCIEMSINLGFAEFEEVKHLIQKPHILSPAYRTKYENLKPLA